MAEIVSSVDARTLANYIGWRAGMGMIKLLNKEALAIRYFLSNI